MNAPSPPARKSITDSPWYWVYLFCTAGAVALLLAGPKFAARQSQIERNYEARQHAAQHVAKPEADFSEEVADRSASTRITLWPLYAVLGSVLSVAWFKLWQKHQRESSSLKERASPSGVAE